MQYVPGNDGCTLCLSTMPSRCAQNFLRPQYRMELCDQLFAALGYLSGYLYCTKMSNDLTYQWIFSHEVSSFIVKLSKSVFRPLCMNKLQCCWRFWNR